ncbi:MAG TPA: globin domain-containing protein [Ktedonobacteraceae bacterium]|jgi:hemoglobin-like flavoprotein|nr:globin domain-containing protein [Ktedonobacteraceae bacterium]
MDPVLLRQSLDLIPDKLKFAQLFYTQLFTDAPAAAALFEHTDWQKQYSALMGAIAFVVAGVERGDDVTPALQTLGKKHEGYGALPEHYPLVGAALITTFQKHVSGFTPAMEATWVQAFAVISGQMIKGAASN